MKNAFNPHNRGHRTTPSQESNTLSVASAMTDLSGDSGSPKDAISRLSEVDDEDELVCDNVKKSGTRECNSQTSDYASDDDILRNNIAIDMSPDPSNRSSSVKISIPETTPTPEKLYPSEPLKTLLSAIFLVVGWIATTGSLALTHERVPETPPLPDIILDNVPYQSWALGVCEILLMISTCSAVLVVMAHKHRLIILRRIWLILGLLYFYRAITMFITVLPKADTNYTCHEKIDNVTVQDIGRRILTIVSGGGLSINGKHIYCGDYIFSGHTLVLAMGYLAIKQYSPRRFFLLHWLSFATSLAGVILLLLARGHYSIDVLVAYWITTRLWWLYHTLAHQQNLKERGDHNLMDGMWWWRIFVYFESNVQGQLPREYSWPIPHVVKMVASKAVVGVMGCCRRGEELS